MKEKTIEKLFILFLIILGIYYMYLASQTQMLGEDEASYYELGKDFSQFKYPVFDNLGKPVHISPLISLVYSIPFMIFGPSLGLAKMIISIFGILTVLIVYLIGKKTNIYYGIAAAFLLLSINLFTHFMFISYVEVPIAFFSAIATYFFLILNSMKKAIITGIIMSLSFYTKQSGLFLFGVLIIYTIFLYFYKKDKKYIKFSIMSIIIAIVLFLPFVVRNVFYYNYPYIHFLNSFFPTPQSLDIKLWDQLLTTYWGGASGRMLSPTMLTIQNYASNFGWLIVLSVIFGFSWLIIEIESNKKITKQLFLFILIFLVFISIFYFLYFSDITIVEPRYLSIIFPQFSLIGGFFFLKFKERNKYFILLIFLVVIIALYSSFNIALSTSNSQRYPNDYIDALKWLKTNTSQDSIILTTYGGSVKYFAERDTIWGLNIPEIPGIMATSNSSYIYDVLKKYNVSYILIWRGVLSDRFMIPESNLIGLFTYNFLNNVVNDKENFNVTYQNQDNIILKVL
jgi:4-amino-4-deoxy-L-arabinose transferase-like glycosyltransferase